MEKATGQHINIHDGTAYAVKPARSAVKAAIQSTHTVSEQQGGVVNLIVGVKFPPQHQKLVRARAKVDSGDGLMLYTQGKQVHELVIADSVVEVGESGCVTVVVENHGGEVVRLSEGKWLGNVTPVEVVETRENGGEERVVSRLEMSPKEAEMRTKRLLEQLQLQLHRLGEEDKVKLASILCSYSAVFALTSCELGATSVTRHSIDTGGHSPIHQSLKRMPFALRPQVDKMVHEMLDQGVIQHSSSPWSSSVVLVKKKDNNEVLRGLSPSEQLHEAG